MLLGLDFLDSAGMYAKNVSNKIVNKNIGCTIPIARKFGHMDLECPQCTILFTRAELKNLHRHFKHPHFDKQKNLLKRSKIQDVDNETRKL